MLVYETTALATSMNNGQSRACQFMFINRDWIFHIRFYYHLRQWELGEGGVYDGLGPVILFRSPASQTQKILIFKFTTGKVTGDLLWHERRTQTWHVWRHFEVFCVKRHKNIYIKYTFLTNLTWSIAIRWILTNLHRFLTSANGNYRWRHGFVFINQLSCVYVFS